MKKEINNILDYHDTDININEINNALDYHDTDPNGNNYSSYSGWGNEIKKKMYYALNSVYKKDVFILQRNNIFYKLEEHAARSGNGGMSQGNPHEISITTITKNHLLKIEN